MNSEINDIFDLIKKRNFFEAKKKCSEVLSQNTNNSEFFNLFAIILFQLKEYNESIDKWKRALEINPKYFFAYNNLGSAFLNLQKFNDALINFNKAIELKPDFLDAYNNKGNVLLKLNKTTESLLCFDQAIKIKPDNIYAYIFKGHALSEIDRLQEALENYKKAYLINPEYPFLLGYIVHTKSKICDWGDLKKNLETIELGLEQGKKVSYPFTILTILDSPYLQKKASEIWVKNYNFEEKKQNIFLKKKNHTKIRIGYFSADFRNHATAHLTAEMFELHDKNKFEIFGFYLGQKIKSDDQWHKRLKISFNEFFDVNSMSEAEISDLSKKKEIDIAVDLMAHCNNGMENKFGAFTKGCAPIQINFLGYPGTSGSKSIDYIIADKTIIPNEKQEFYTEKIIYLPNSYQPNIKNTKISNTNFTKEDFNLPKDKFILCCFNQHQKITPEVFSVWMNILESNKNTVLWLLEDNIYSNKNLIIEASKRKIDSKRIIFAPRLPLEKHLTRIRFSDLFLDTFPYTAHTTCSDSLRMGLPIVTLIGNSFASRVASSLLYTMNLKELVTKTFLEYEKLVNKIIKDPIYLKSIKEKIKKNVSISPLYDCKLFTKNLEKAYLELYDKYTAEKKIDNIEV